VTPTLTKFRYLDPPNNRGLEQGLKVAKRKDFSILSVVLKMESSKSFRKPL
jgi:hypothetical protein